MVQKSLTWHPDNVWSTEGSFPLWGVLCISMWLSMKMYLPSRRMYALLRFSYCIAIAKNLVSHTTLAPHASILCLIVSLWHVIISASQLACFCLHVRIVNHVGLLLFCCFASWPVQTRLFTLARQEKRAGSCCSRYWITDSFHKELLSVVGFLPLFIFLLSQETVYPIIKLL